MDVVYPNRFGYRLEPGSVCAITRLKKEDVEIEMMAGDVLLNLKKLRKMSRFSLRTPTSVAAVRGTQFWARVLPGGTVYAVKEGKVAIAVPGGKTFDLKAGEAVDISAGGEISSVRPLKEEENSALAGADEIDVKVKDLLYDEFEW